MQRLFRVATAFLLLLLLTTGSIAQKREPSGIQITGVYSSMHYIEEAGDVVGIEVFIVYGGDGYYATVQIAEGMPGPPVVVKVEVKGSSIEFTLPASASELDPGKFRGVISASGIRGKFESAEKTEFLNRRRSYWQ